jgi:hypothetical protein
VSAVDEGIRQTASGYLVRVEVAPHPRKAKRFPADTPIHKMREWRDRTQRELTQHRDRTRFRPQPFPVPVKAIDGYCYIYFAVSDGFVKIGRAINPRQRMAELAVGSAHPITLVATALAHASLEQLIQKRFKSAHRQGEWYELNADLERFIGKVRDGVNIVELVFAELRLPGEAVVLQAYDERGLPKVGK